VKSIGVPIAGIVAAAALDHHLSWATLASVLVALYCHRIYGACCQQFTEAPVAVIDHEFRPGWAARWGASGKLDTGPLQPTQSEVR
jgi:hypothetical protein